MRDFWVARSDTQSWTSERRIDQISRSAQTGATWFFHARSSVMEYDGFVIGGRLDRNQLSANIRTGTRDADGSMYSPFDFDVVTIDRYSCASASS